MTLLLLEALGAGLLFIVIIWWTMFSGRKNGELPHRPDTAGVPDRSQPVENASPAQSENASQ
jgi:hypothetical protein